jgi:hypothetical protein
MPEQIWEAAGEFRVVAPSTKSTRAILVVLGAITAIGGVITVVTVPRGASTVAATNAIGYGLTMLVAGGFFFAFLLIWSANVRLLIGRRAVGYRDGLRRSHFWSRGEISHVVDMSIDYGWFTQTGQRALYCFGLDGRRLLVLSTFAWKADDLGDFVEATGVHVDVRDRPVPIRTASREFPKGFTWGSRHILAMSCLSMFAVIGVVIALVVLFVH